MLPHGDVGRIVNSFVYGRHVDAVAWQRKFRMSLCVSTRHPCSEEIKGKVYLVTTTSIGGRTKNIIYLPDLHRMLMFDYVLSVENMMLCKKGGLPTVWYPQKRLTQLILLYGDTYEETYM